MAKADFRLKPGMLMEFGEPSSPSYELWVLLKPTQVFTGRWVWTAACLTPYGYLSLCFIYDDEQDEVVLSGFLPVG